MKCPSFLIGLFMLLGSVSVHAELTEFKAIEQGLTQSHIQNLTDARLEQARGKYRAAGRWDNPELEYSQENLELPSGRSEETGWWLRQRLNISGSKGLERDAAALAQQAAEAQALLERRQWRADIRNRFYTALYARSRAQTLADHLLRVQRIATVIEQRRAAGDASRYDRLRITQELVRAQSAYAEAQAEQQTQRQRLLSLIGGRPDSLAGSLLPPAVEPGDAAQEQAIEQHPQLQMLAALKQSALLSAKAAERDAWPEVSVGIGRKTLDEAGYSADGSTVALSVEIPLFDRSQGETQRAHGLVHEYAADYALAYRRLRSDNLALRTSLAAQRESAEALQRAATMDDSSLGAMAEASYEAGEMNVMELLDAYRAELDTRLQYIDSARAARATFIQLQQLEGQ